MSNGGRGGTRNSGGGPPSWHDGAGLWCPIYQCPAPNRGSHCSLQRIAIALQAARRTCKGCGSRSGNCWRHIKARPTQANPLPWQCPSPRRSATVKNYSRLLKVKMGQYHQSGKLTGLCLNARGKGEGWARGTSRAAWSSRRARENQPQTPNQSNVNVSSPQSKAEKWSCHDVIRCARDGTCGGYSTSLCRQRCGCPCSSSPPTVSSPPLLISGHPARLHMLGVSRKPHALRVACRPKSHPPLVGGGGLQRFS